MSKSNIYVRAIDRRFFEETPKAIFAAIAISLSLKENEGDWMLAEATIVKEWDTLFKNRIVLAPVPKRWRAMTALLEGEEE